MRRLMIRLLLFLIDRHGGLSFGGPGTNTIRDIINNINSGGGVPSDPLNSVQFHSPQGAFKGNADFRYIQGSGLLMGINTKIVLNANGGSSDQYIVYNSTNDYTELFVDGALRAQF